MAFDQSLITADIAQTAKNNPQVIEIFLHGAAGEILSNTTHVSDIETNNRTLGGSYRSRVSSTTNNFWAEAGGDILERLLARGDCTIFRCVDRTDAAGKAHLLSQKSLQYGTPSSGTSSGWVDGLHRALLDNGFYDFTTPVDSFVNLAISRSSFINEVAGYTLPQSTSIGSVLFDTNLNNPFYHSGGFGSNAAADEALDGYASTANAAFDPLSPFTTYNDQVQTLQTFVDTIAAYNGNGRVVLVTASDETVNFTVGDTLTGSVSGGTGTIRSITTTQIVLEEFTSTIAAGDSLTNQSSVASTGAVSSATTESPYPSTPDYQGIIGMIESATKLMLGNPTSRTITVPAGLWDDHSDAMASHPARGNALFAGIEHALQMIDAAGRTGTILIRVIGEFGRNMNINSADGMDHGANQSSYWFGGTNFINHKGIVGSTVLDISGQSFGRLFTNPAPGSETHTPFDEVATLLRIFGISNPEYLTTGYFGIDEKATADGIAGWTPFYTPVP